MQIIKKRTKEDHPINQYLYSVNRNNTDNYFTERFLIKG